MSDFTAFPDFASERLGARVIEANDEFFAPKENLLKPQAPVFIEHRYTDRGKWMDGWETRRRRTPGYDWCLIRLGLPGIVRGVVVDTSFFRGNYPEHFSLEACDLGQPPFRDERKRLHADRTQWFELLPRTALKGDSRNVFSVNHPRAFTHLRMKIYPDGGVARLRVHGEVVPAARRVARGEFDLVALENGGRVIASSDQFFSAPLNLLMPGRAKNMGDGWETRRRRGPGSDWVILRLAVPGVIRRVEVDTSHFKGNFPESCSIETCRLENPAAEELLTAPAGWKTLLPRMPLRADRRHTFRGQLRDTGVATHLRLQIYPDGGVSRLRVFGRAERPTDRLKGIELFNALSPALARRALLDCCGSEKWAAQMAARRPFADVAQLQAAAGETWQGLGRKDWLSAFCRHPAIGGKEAKARQSPKARRWSAGEQSAAQQSSSAETLAVLAAANDAYRATFGYVFLICATGKTSTDILQNLRQRLSNDPETELKVAAEEQRKITGLRLQKLVQS